MRVTTTTSYGEGYVLTALLIVSISACKQLSERQLKRTGAVLASDPNSVKNYAIKLARLICFARNNVERGNGGERAQLLNDNECVNKCFARRYVSYIQTSGTRYTFRPDRTVELPLLVASMTCYSSCCFLLSIFFLQMLNLTHDWLRSFLPHVLTKIDRVGFGLLTPADLQRALEVTWFALLHYTPDMGTKRLEFRPGYVWSWNKAIGRPVSVLGL